MMSSSWGDADVGGRATDESVPTPLRRSRAPALIDEIVTLTSLPCDAGHRSQSAVLFMKGLGATIFKAIKVETIL
jgi:hypothetical protein